ncbi:MAG: ABC transporter permease [Kiritimatiellae bacterium]|nr:ABC transporter permease [Kiritimatiellia bacterium]
MSSTIDISTLGMIAAYALLLIPLAMLLWQGVSIVSRVGIAVVRMTVQLLFVGLYLQFVFNLDNAWLNCAWLLIMILVADVSILRHCRLRVRCFGQPLFVALVMGTAIPVLYFTMLILHRPHILEARYLIPIGGMILGNCLRADIIGIRHFYDTIKRDHRTFELTLAQGAQLHEAIRPYLREAFHNAVSPTIATMMTIGLVSLPGMMTGVILGGQPPVTAIKYQVAIMIAVFTGTAIAVPCAILMSLKRGFSPSGPLRRDVFAD